MVFEDCSWLFSRNRLSSTILMLRRYTINRAILGLFLGPTCFICCVSFVGFPSFLPPRPGATSGQRVCHQAIRNEQNKLLGVLVAMLVKGTNTQRMKMMDLIHPNLSPMTAATTTIRRGQDDTKKMFRFGAMHPKQAQEPASVLTTSGTVDHLQHFDFGGQGVRPCGTGK